MATLTQAFSQWNSRPADERYNSLEDFHAACARYRSEAGVATLNVGDLHARVIDGRVALNGRTETTADLTHWSFGQFARYAGAPADYLRKLSPDLAVECLNHGLVKLHDADERVRVLFNRNGDLRARAFTSERYTRIWDSDISRRLLDLKARGPWQEAPAAFDGSRGLYKGDRDCFAFMVDSGRRIFETLPGGGLSRGFFVWNSEVGAASFGIMTFLYEYVCGNHRVWGARDISELRIRHVGAADERAFRDLTVELRKYSDESETAEVERISRARAFVLGEDKEAVLDRVLGLKLPGLTIGRASEALAIAEKRVEWYGDPRTAWGYAGGLTELARDLPHADDRVALDRAAGRVMEIAF